jgi:hypothetical protein
MSVAQSQGKVTLTKSPKLNPLLSSIHLQAAYSVFVFWVTASPACSIALLGSLQRSRRIHTYTSHTQPCVQMHEKSDWEIGYSQLTARHYRKGIFLACFSQERDVETSVADP